VSQNDKLLNDKRQKALKLIEEWIEAEEKVEKGSNDEKPKEVTNITEHHFNNEMKEKKER
jgi:hypothetical protein